ncbi:MAG: 4Fe-4S dicluster domain-containing protein [Candidatus Thermoplasmatota archaeon]
MEEIIDADKLDHNFKYRIAKQPGGENIMKCFQCGTCTASCPVWRVNEKYNPRKIIRMAILGLKDEVIKSDFVWLCASCYTCFERCPQDVRITELMTAMKNIAVEDGYIHPSFIERVKLIEEKGRLLEITEFENEKRLKLGLPELGKSTGELGKIVSAIKKRG